MEKLIHGKLSEEIIGAAMAVQNELKPGLDEKLYENALVIELRERGHPCNPWWEALFGLSEHEHLTSYNQNPASRRSLNNNHA